MEHHNSGEILCHFVVINEKFRVLMRGYVFENRRVMLSFRHDAPEDGEVSESYSGFDCILSLIPPGTLPTIQFGDAEKIKRFIADI